MITRFIPSKRITRWLSCLLFCLLLSGLLTGCSSNLSVSKTGFFLDTVISITLYHTDCAEPLETCFALLESYEALFSRTKEGSDVWNINHSGGKPVSVSEETAKLLHLALQYAQLSDGAFDPTIASVLSLWNFDADRKTGTVPDASALSDALTHVNYETIQVSGTSVTLLDPEASIDLGGIAKGYIADRLKESLLADGCTSAIIDLGGNLLTIGKKSWRKDFTIGIRNPQPDSSNSIFTAISCQDQSVVTSGTYERYFVQNGVTYHHILDPQTGFPANQNLASVTILSNSSAQGDALSTACFVLGAKKGLELIESLDHTEALFITDDLQTIASSGWPVS